MNILISNDDGYLSPGIAALAAALRELAEVVVVAPEHMVALPECHAALLVARGRGAHGEDAGLGAGGVGQAGTVADGKDQAV